MLTCPRSRNGSRRPKDGSVPTKPTKSSGPGLCGVRAIHPPGHCPGQSRVAARRHPHPPAADHRAGDVAAVRLRRRCAERVRDYLRRSDRKNQSLMKTGRTHTPFTGQSPVRRRGKEFDLPKGITHMALIFVTGASTGLGFGHCRVPRPAGPRGGRTRPQLRPVRRYRCAGMRGAVSGDLLQIDQTLNIARQANWSGVFDGVIHNAGSTGITAHCRSTRSPLISLPPQWPHPDV
jgi:hypothetical protein